MSLPPVRNVRTEFIDKFGKNMSLRENVKQKFIAKRQEQQYISENYEGSPSKFLPVKMVDAVIDERNIRQIVELLIHARALYKAIIQGAYERLDIFFQTFLLQNFNYNIIAEQKQKFSSNKRKYEHYKRWKQDQNTLRSIIPYGHLLPNPEPHFNFNEEGHAVQSQYNMNYNNPSRIQPNYEMLGPTGYYNQNVNSVFKTPFQAAQLRWVQQALREMIAVKDPALFFNIDLFVDVDFFVELLGDEAIEFIIYIRNSLNHILVMIEKLERAKVELINFAISTGQVDQFDALINLRERNIKAIAEKYNIEPNAVQIEKLVELTQSPNSTEANIAELRAFIQPNKLPKIRQNLNRLRGLKQNAATRKAGGRRSRRQTARK